MPVLLSARPAAAAPVLPAAPEQPVLPEHPAAVTQPAAPAHVHRYTVRRGDTLSGIAGRLCHRVIDWTGIYASNRRVIGGNPDLIIPGQRLRIACYDPPVMVTAHRHSRFHHHARLRHHSRLRQAAHYAAGGGTLSYAGLEALWRSAGGASWAASTAACIAEHESSGRQYETGPYGERGYFQIHPSWGALSTYDAYGNARAAVIISRDGRNWAPWTTHSMCGV